MTRVARIIEIPVGACLLHSHSDHVGKAEVFHDGYTYYLVMEFTDGKRFSGGSERTIQRTQDGDRYREWVRDLFSEE